MRTRSVVIVVGDPLLVERCRRLAPVEMHVVERAPEAATYALTVWRPRAVVIRESDIASLGPDFSETATRVGAVVMRVGLREPSDEELRSLLMGAPPEPVR